MREGARTYRWLSDAAAWARKHPIVTWCSVLTIPLVFLGAIIGLVTDTQELIQPDATIDIGPPRIATVASGPVGSKHVRLPITALHGPLENVEARIMLEECEPSIHADGSETLFFARTWGDNHAHNDPGEINWTPESKLKHLKEEHFSNAKAYPILNNGSTIEANVLIKIEGFDKYVFLGNQYMDKLTQVDAFQLVVKVTAKKAQAKTINLVVDNALSFAEIKVSQPPQRASSNWFLRD